MSHLTASRQSSIATSLFFVVCCNHLRNRLSRVAELAVLLSCNKCVVISAISKQTKREEKSTKNEKKTST